DAVRIASALTAAATAELGTADAEVLLHARGDDLQALCALAGPVRDAAMAHAGRPGIVTYSRKVFLPITRLCRDRCHYCTFATVPGRLPVLYLSEDDVLEIAREGAAMGCKEALFTLGDAPEDRWPAARAWLTARGFDSTIAYVAHLAQRVLDETGLLPHLNPGVMTYQTLLAARPLAPSMGMMLETTATRLWSEPGGVHYGSPDKDPELRMQVLRDAGRARVPFTTGILVGIGETYAERIDSILAIRDVIEEFDNVQEVIVQNFRAKDDTAMRGEDDLDHEEYLATIAVSRLLLGASVSLQAPPNLSDPGQREQLLAAGVDDWGGVSPLTPDHVNPERPWPQLDDLAATTRAAGFVLAERLTAHPRFVLDALGGSERWIDPALHAPLAALADPRTGLALESARPLGRAMTGSRRGS
ncbi:MAG: 7,8-didemethyl-8-hydroxy-5-deazariboflavin synthase CofG, partial [Janthinobacterium lividum]